MTWARILILGTFYTAFSGSAHATSHTAQRTTSGHEAWFRTAIGHILAGKVRLPSHHDQRGT